MEGHDIASPLAISVDGGDIFAWVCGTGDPAIIFMHGWTLDHRVWQPQLRDTTLAASHRLIAIDRRGFGRSSAPADLAREAADILKLLSRLDISRAVLVGQSQAGRVALQIALDHGDRVAGLVLVGAPVGGFHPLPRPEEDVPVARWRALVAAGEIDEMKKLWSAHPLIANGKNEALIGAILDDYDGRDLLAPPAPSGPLIQHIGAIASPALVVTGHDDTPWRQLVGDAMAYALPQARRVTLDDAGHLCNVDAPGRFNELLGGFAAGLQKRQ